MNTSPSNDSLVIIPTYNEKENIEDILNAVFALATPFDVLVVDDGSPDGTGDIVKRVQESVNHKKGETHRQLHLLEREGKMGLGAAYIAGFGFAIEKGYDYIFEMDADFSHNPNDLLKLKAACEKDGNDMAVGSRYVEGVNVVNWPMGRVLMSYGAGIYVRMITGMSIMDPTAGFVCYKREVLEALPLDKIKFVGYAFQIEMKFDAAKFGFKVTEIPIIFTDRTRGQSKMSANIFREAVFGVMKLKIASWFSSYKR